MMLVGETVSKFLGSITDVYSALLFITPMRLAYLIKVKWWIRWKIKKIPNSFNIN